MQALEKLWQQLTAAMGLPALILVATAFVLVEFLDALLKVTEKNVVVSLPAVILFSLGSLFALGFVIRTRYDVDVQRAFRQATLAGTAGSLVGALIYAFEVTLADSPADAFARYVVLGWPLGLCYGFALSLLDPPELPMHSSPSVGAESTPPAASGGFSWRVRVTVLAIFLATIVLPPAAVVARFVVEWPVPFVSSESILFGLAVVLLIKAYLRLRGEACHVVPNDDASGNRRVQVFSDTVRRMVLLITALLGTGVAVWDAEVSFLPAMPFVFSTAEAVPLAVLTITLLLVSSTAAYMLAVVSPPGWLLRIQIVVVILLVLVGGLSVPRHVREWRAGLAERVERETMTLDPDAALAKARDHTTLGARAKKLSSVGRILREQGRLADAESTIREAIVTRATLGSDGEESMADDRDVLAQLLTRRASYRDAEELLRQVVATRTALFEKTPSPPNRLRLLASRRALASSLVDQEEYERADALLRVNDEWFRQIVRPTSFRAIFSDETWRPYTARGNRERLQEYANHLMLCGRVAREASHSAFAEQCLKTALRIAEQLESRLEKSGVDVATVHARLGRLYFLTDRLEEADVELHRALAANPGRSVAGVVKAYMADVRSAEQRFADAESMYREAGQLLEETLGPDHPYHLMVLPGLARALAQRGNHVRALEVVARAQVLAARIYGPDARQTVSIQDACREIVTARHRAERAEMVATGAKRTRKASVADRSRDPDRLCGARESRSGKRLMREYSSGRDAAPTRGHSATTPAPPIQR